MSAAIAVLNRNPSRSSVTFLTVLLVRLASSAGSASAPDGSPSPMRGSPQATRDALDAAPVPGSALVPGTYEHQEVAQGVRRQRST